MKQHEKVLIILAAAKGKAVTVAELVAQEEAAGYEAYRMSTYMWKLRGKMQAEIKVNKNGKNVVSYELTNWKKFENFQPAVKAKKVKAPKVAKPKVAKAPSKPKTKTKAPAKEKVRVVEERVVNDGSVPFAIDEDFDSADHISAENISDLVDVG